MLMKAESHSGQAQLKRGNLMAIFRQLRLHPGQSRVDLANALDLTKSTVSALVRELIDNGWLLEREVVVTGDIGRRPTPLFVDPARLLLLGTQVGIGHVRVVLTSLTGEVLAARSAGYDTELEVEACIAELTRNMLAVAARRGDAQRIIGIGVGLPGGVDQARDQLVFSPHVHWHQVPFGALLREALHGTPLAGVPVFMQNDADVAALGETEFNPSPTADPLLLVLVGEGVGAGLVVGGRLLTGARGLAGEVGHMVLQIDGPRCSCGRRGCAEALIGNRALMRQDGDAPDLARAGQYLGVLLQNLAVAYDPACIVLGGPAVELGDALLAPVRATLQDYAQAARMPEPTLRVARFGADAIAVGAAALAGYRLTQPTLG
ncbi:ROK family transcriptional regulator [Roseateles asaccharophilus]|uniref:NBD/HSP70 family sugar kinase n=1 Tax=Roseateles asaccharophilus TaxID=582607 RepID=A0ABU2A213_9BURK|nr:ROK family transcriptional regulator [Roseateles asaccharophilus]MDR7331229.1 putative NBD/HSP70 family sugar kinase [Roseateles asaccharophilus]